MSKSPNSNILGRMIGKGNEGFIIINSVAMKALIDSGSQISTITEESLDQLDPRPKLRSMDDFLYPATLKSEGYYVILSVQKFAFECPSVRSYVRPCLRWYTCAAHFTKKKYTCAAIFGLCDCHTSKHVQNGLEWCCVTIFHGWKNCSTGHMDKICPRCPNCP